MLFPLSERILHSEGFEMKKSIRMLWKTRTVHICTTASVVETSSVFQDTLLLPAELFSHSDR